MIGPQLNTNIFPKYELKPVFGSGREARLKWVKSVFKDKIQTLYGYEENYVEDLEKNLSLKTRVLIEDNCFSGLIIYRSFLKQGCFEVDLFYCCDRLKHPEPAIRFLINDVLKTSQQMKAKSLAVKVSKKSHEMLRVFQRENFKKTEVDKPYLQFTKSLEELPALPKERAASFESMKFAEPSRKRGRDEEKYDLNKRQKHDSHGIPIVLSSQRPREEPQRVVKECSIMLKYFTMIKSGSKTIEGRINSGMFNNLKVGEFIRFKNGNQYVLTKITKIKTYPTFLDLLSKEGVKKCLPDIDDLAHAVSIYKKIPGYAQKERRFGVVAIEIELIKP